MFNTLAKQTSEASSKFGVNKGISISLESLIALRPYSQALKLYGTKRVATLRAGKHQSLLRGRGMEIQRSPSSYQAGDDITPYGLACDSAHW